jgi:hypothetical protein
MNSVVPGVVVLVVTILVLVWCLPRGGKMHRFVGTELEPYVAVVLCAGFALAFGLILSGFLPQ